MICEYGCGQKAKYQFKNGKWCCSKKIQSCFGIREKVKKKQKGKTRKFESIKIGFSNKICDYGCGQIAKYIFQNGKYCCSKHYGKCPMKRSKLSNSLKKVYKNGFSKEHIKNLSASHLGQKPTEKARKKMKENNWWKFATKKEIERRNKKVSEGNKKWHKEIGFSEKTRKKMKENNSGPKSNRWNPNREEVLRGYTDKFFNKKFRRQILEEQNFICPICKKNLGNNSGIIHFHHIDHNRQNDKNENIVALHRKCHGKTNGSSKNRNHWKSILEKK